LLQGKKRLLGELGKQAADLRQRREALMHQLSEIRDQRFALRQGVVDSINANVEPTIKVQLAQHGNTDEYYRFVADALRSASVKHQVVALKIAASVPPHELASLVRREDWSSLAAQSGINSDQATKVVAALNQQALLCDLEIVDLDDQPAICLKDGDSYKDSQSLSTGQKCTSILPILLLESDRPLLVDQPEDNLDNGFIYETVVKRLQQIQQTRQLIFVTHNPNIPVLGAAERVFVLESNGSRAWLKCQGSVDECRDPIVELLEGGDEAFELRQRKYSPLRDSNAADH
jgi:hypothetical protein